MDCSCQQCYFSQDDFMLEMHPMLGSHEAEDKKGVGMIAQK